MVLYKDDFLAGLKSENKSDGKVLEAMQILILNAGDFQGKVINKRFIDILNKVDAHFLFDVVRSGNSYRFTIFLRDNYRRYTVSPVYKDGSREEAYIRENRRLAFGSLALAIEANQKELRSRIDDRNGAINDYDSYKRLLDDVNAKIKEAYRSMPKCLQVYMHEYGNPSVIMRG